MPNLPISGLTASATNAASTDLLPVVQTVGVGPVRMTMQQVAGGLLGSTSFSGATVTTSSPLINLAQTWNAGAVTFTGLKFNVTDTASASGSLLMDLQVGGTSQFSVRKNGLVTLSSLSAASTLSVVAAGTTAFEVGPSSAKARFEFWLGDGSLANPAILTRKAAATLQLGAADAAAPVAQTLGVQSVVAGTSNTAGTDFTINGSAGTGTGAGGSIVFKVAPAGSSGSAQNALATALTIDSTKLSTFAGNIAVPSNGTITGSSNTVTFGSSFRIANATSTGSINFATANGPVYLSGTLDTIPFGWGTANGLNNTGLSAALWCEAANSISQRNGANAQTKRLYGTYTDSSNYRRLAMTMSTSGVAEIKPEGAGTGASGNVLYISGLPTSNPGPGILWNNAGSVAIGT